MSYTVQCTKLIIFPPIEQHFSNGNDCEPQRDVFSFAILAFAFIISILVQTPDTHAGNKICSIFEVDIGLEPCRYRLFAYYVCFELFIDVCIVYLLLIHKNEINE